MTTETTTAATTGATIVLAADHPAALAAFYADLMGVEAEPGLSSSHWRLPWPPGGWLELYAPSRSRPRPRSEGRLALCLQHSAEGADPMPALSTWAQAAITRGATLREPPRRESFGAECWLLDPEGNRLLLLMLE